MTNAAPLAAVPPTPTAEQLLAAGKRSDVRAIAGLAERIETQLADLRERIAADREAALARAEVVELEAKLAAAKAKLPGKKPKTTTGTGDRTCPDCGKTGYSNLGVHRSRAHGVTAD